MAAPCSEALDLRLRGESLRLAYHARSESPRTILYLHGLGSSKGDFLEAWSHPELAEFSLLAFDFPGCGESADPASGELGLNDLADAVGLFLDALSVRRTAVVGHSLGGITGLLFARRNLDRVTSFVNIEGNLAPEDCAVFSRAVASGEYDRGYDLLGAFARQIVAAGRPGFRRFARGLCQQVSERALRAYCASIVSHSDNQPLLEDFLSLGIPRLFLYGEENSQLSYIPRLEREGVEVRAISGSNHFPAYSNPEEYWQVLTDFLVRSEGAGSAR